MTTGVMGRAAFRSNGWVISVLFFFGGSAFAVEGVDRAGPVLQLRVGDVRLMRTVPPQNQAGTRTGRDKRHVIQFDGPLTRRQKRLLEGVGVRLEDYLPQYAYLTNLAGVDRKKLAELGFVRHVGPFRREWRIDPALLALGGNLLGTAVPAAKRDPLALERYRQYLGVERAGLLAEGKVQVTVSTFRGTSVDQAMNDLPAVEGLELYGGATVGERAVIDVVVPLASLNQLAAVPFVQFVEDAPRGVLRNSTTTRVVQSGTNTDTPLWDRGLHGEDQIIGLIDATPKLTHCMFADSEPIGPTHRKIVAVRPDPPPSAHVHGTMVAGVLSGDDGPYGIPNGEDGVALASRFSYSDFFAVNANPSTLLARLTDAHNDGARVHSNSWGDDGTTSYTTWCSQIDQFSYDNEDDLVCFAATNTSTLKTPENAKNVLAVGASNQYPGHGSHCSGGKGPTFDGRRKPEIYAPGCAVRSASVFSTCGTRTDSGTSFACPAIAASGALVRQYYTEGFYPSGARQPVDAFTPSGALMKATLLNAAVDMTGVAGYPSDLEGWGRLVLDEALHFAGELRRLIVRDVRHANGLNTGETGSFDVTVWGDLHDLRVTMVFTDPPAAAGSSNPVVNNLDLQVTGPSSGVAGGSIYRGNNFKNGQSLAGGTADPLNNVEQVYLPAPAMGTYTIEVIGTQVNSVAAQGYAVVVSGQVVEGAFDPPLGFADHDADGDMDLVDFAAFQRCFSGDGQAYGDGSCAVFDADADADVDLTDFDPFQQVLTGPQ